MAGRILLVILSLAAWNSINQEAHAMNYQLAKDGQATVTVVVQADADSIVQQAATDLAAYIGKISGIQPGVVKEGTPLQNISIQIGLTDAVRQANLPLKELREEGYLIDPQPEAILICGRTPDGTVAGVYGFLRDNLGVRWFMPGELWEVVPKAASLSVKVNRVLVNPDFNFRIWSGNHSAEGTRWQIRNLLTRTRNNIPYYGFGHNLKTIFPVSKYGKDHPEYYAEINGKRFLPASDTEERSEPCFTNPDVVRITIEAVRAYFDKNPNASQFSLCVNDNADFCTCDNCLKLDSPVRNHRTGRQYSESYFSFVDQVAREIAKSHPGKTLGCYAYWAVELPPRNIERLPDNVMILLTQDTSQHFDTAYRDRDRALYLEWSKMASHLGKYDYYGLGWFSPRYFPHLAAEDLKFLHEKGITGSYCEVYPYWAITAPQLYMASQLLWNAEQNPDALLDEYFNSLYGESAPSMKEFYSILEQIWIKERPGQWFQGLDYINPEFVNFDAAAMNRAMNLLNQAYEKSAGTICQRVEYIRNGFQFSHRIVIGYDAAMSLKGFPLENPEDGVIILKAMKDTLGLAASARQAYETYMKPDPLYKHSYYDDADRFWRKYDGWEQLVSGAVLEAATRLMEWSKQKQSAEKQAVLSNELKDLLDQADLRKKIELKIPSAENPGSHKP